MKELGALQGKTDDASKARMQELGHQIAEAQTKMQALRAAPAVSPDGDAAKTDELAVLRATLGQIAAQITELEKEGSDAAKAKIKVLQEQYTQVKTRLKSVEGGAGHDAPVEIHGDGKPPAKKD
jgi:chromosome segregation ATPase